MWQIIKNSLLINNENAPLYENHHAKITNNYV